MKILIINGYEKHVDSNGQLNATLFSRYIEQLKNNNDIKISNIEDYQRTDEINKWLWADTVLIQFPIYWFNMPGKLKSYFDDIFAYGIFYGLDYSIYGQGGKLQGKRFALSTTWNAPENVFNVPDSFFSGKSLEDVLLPAIKTMEFVGIEPLQPQYLVSFHDVVHNPDIDKYLHDQQEFIEKSFK
ncbi:MAG: NAD(P)H-dependent oxidoreductase [Lactobacillaceae bacterium]|jgi:modulator of drug activity B|nr:NAD(P)H-dependent oxidoreductase [Lactobacillaceae bacterium]